MIGVEPACLGLHSGCWGSWVLPSRPAGVSFPPDIPAQGRNAASVLARAAREGNLRGRRTQERCA